MLHKVSIIGAGAVGATLAHRVLESGLADVALIDVVKGLACAKSFDLLDAAPIVGHEKHILGSESYEDIEDSDIVVITAGLTRKPGMTREDLIAKNAAIVKDISLKVKDCAPGSIVVVVTNPLDAMTYLAYKVTNFDRNKVFGMAGILDASRFVHLVSHELKVPRSSIETFILGSHGDTMVPVISHTRVQGKPITSLMSKETLDRIVKRTRDRGAEIVGLLGTGSAYYSPSAAVFRMIRAISGDTGERLVVSACLQGEYGLNDICIGVPCKIGKTGIKEIIELELSGEEDACLRRSASAIKASLRNL